MSTRTFAGALVAATSLALLIGCGSGNRGDKSDVMLTGCLRPGNQPDAYQLVATGSPNAAVATRGGPQTSETANPTGTAARSTSSDIGAAATELYTLFGDKNVDLSRYQGSVVQVRGRIERQERTTAASGPTGTNQAQAAPGTQAGPSTTGGSAGSAGRRAPGAGEEPTTTQLGTGGNPVTGVGPQSFAEGQPVNRPAKVVHVQSVRRITAACGDR